MTKTPRTGSYVGGKYQIVLGIPESIRGTFQPATGDDLQSLPEGRRLDQTFRIFTKSQLTGPTQDNQGAGDLITVFGNDYEVVQVQPWQNTIISHYSALVQGVKE